MEKPLRKPDKDQYPQKIFAHQLLTAADLFEFKKELLQELLTALRSHPNLAPKKWMKSHEVRRLLKVSPGTLQTLKSSGTLPYTKVGGVHFFDYQDIQNILESGKINARHR
jgi:hypothetical protein